MIVYSTVLDINGQPTLYSVYKNGKLAFLNPNNLVKNAPILFAKRNNSDWQIRGTQDSSLMDQVLREIE